MDEQTSGIIPGHNSGAKTDVVSAEEFHSIAEAKAFYNECRLRLLNVNEWSVISGKGRANFTLTDSTGNEVLRPVQSKGDHFKIDIPGPGTITGEGYDWVRIEAIEDKSGESEEHESITITVRPVGNPKNDKPDVAHFFTEEATSSFVVERNGTTVTAEVHGRNEKPNTDAKAVVDKTRNTVIAAGAMAGFSELQWKSLVKGILGK